MLLFNQEKHELAEHIWTTEILNSKGSLLSCDVNRKKYFNTHEHTQFLNMKLMFYTHTCTCMFTRTHACTHTCKCTHTFFEHEINFGIRCILMFLQTAYYSLSFKLWRDLSTSSSCNEQLHKFKTYSCPVLKRSFIFLYFLQWQKFTLQQINPLKATSGSVSFVSLWMETRVQEDTPF